MKAYYAAIAALAAAFGLSTASAQEYPTKPLRIVTGSVGGGSDFVSRQLSPGLSQALGQPVTVDNQGTGLINMQYTLKQQPDGYTLIVGNVSLWIVPLLMHTPYDIVKDFQPITQVERSPNVLVVHPALPVKSVKELIALAKAHPGQLNHGVATAGSSTHLAAELFKSLAHVDIVVVPYKGGGPALTGLLSGEVQMTIDGAQLIPQINAGKLRALGVGSTTPSPKFPGVPPISDTVPGYESIGLTGVWVLGNTPQPIVRRLNEEIVRILNKPDVRERLTNAGLEVVGNSPDEFSNIIKADKARMEKVIQDAKIQIPQ